MHIFSKIIYRLIKIIGHFDQAFGAAKLWVRLCSGYRNQLNHFLIFLSDEHRFAAQGRIDQIAQTAFRLRKIYLLVVIWQYDLKRGRGRYRRQAA